VLLSGLLGISLLAIVTAVAGASRMGWHVFMGAGLLGRVARFLIVYEAAAFALKKDWGHVLTCRPPSFRRPA